MAVVAQARRSMGEADNAEDRLRPHRPERTWLSEGAPFSPPVIRIIRWMWNVTIDHLTGLLGTRSHVIVLSPEQQAEVLSRARGMLDQHFGTAAGRPVDIPMACRCWKAVRL
jgi:hypothetical protein